MTPAGLRGDVPQPVIVRGYCGAASVVPLQHDIYRLIEQHSKPKHRATYSAEEDVAMAAAQRRSLGFKPGDSDRMCHTCSRVRSECALRATQTPQKAAAAGGRSQRQRRRDEASARPQRDAAGEGATCRPRRALVDRDADDGRSSTAGPSRPAEDGRGCEAEAGRRRSPLLGACPPPSPPHTHTHRPGGAWLRLGDGSGGCAVAVASVVVVVPPLVLVRR
jgi:hypothetical protein